MTVDEPAVLAEFTQAFERYEQALMANDVEVLDSLFRRSPSTVRYGVGENLYGYEEIQRFRAERPGGSPQRRLGKVAITVYGDSCATADAEFFRENSDRRGRQTQSWVKFATGWKVVSARRSRPPTSSSSAKAQAGSAARPRLGSRTRASGGWSPHTSR